MTEWIMTGQQDYVVGLEPGNCLPEGRVEARKNGRLAMLEPGERKEINLEIGVLTDKDDVKMFFERMSGSV